MKVFLAIFAAFWLTGMLIHSAPWGHEERPNAEPLKPEYYQPATVRTVRAKLSFDGMECTGCHMPPGPGEASPWDKDPRKKGEFHELIKLEHGSNDRCFNCHNKDKMDSFVQFDGTAIAFKSVEQLCAKCHGPVFRDWNGGAHGRRSGYWNNKMGPQKREVCIACHNPHTPKFAKINAAPPPVPLHRLDEAKHPAAHAEGGR